jgi:hypothetical protein
MGDSDKASVQTVWGGRMPKRLNETQIPSLWTEKTEKKWDFRILQQWLWSFLSSEVWRLVKEPAAYIIQVLILKAAGSNFVSRTKQNKHLKRERIIPYADFVSIYVLATERKPYCTK